MAAVMLPLPLSLAPRKFLALVRARRMHSSSLPQHSTRELFWVRDPPWSSVASCLRHSIRAPASSGAGVAFASVV